MVGGQFIENLPDFAGDFVRYIFLSISNRACDVMVVFIYFNRDLFYRPIPKR
jgi:hypothetical protein